MVNVERSTGFPVKSDARLEGALAALTEAQLRDWSAIGSFVHGNCVDPTFLGVDWTAARESVAPRIEAGLDNDAFTALMDETLAPLKDYHPLSADAPIDGFILDLQAHVGGRTAGDTGWFGGGIVADQIVPGSGWDEITGEEDPAAEKTIEGLAFHP